MFLARACESPEIALGSKVWLPKIAGGNCRQVAVAPLSVDWVSEGVTSVVRVSKKRLGERCMFVVVYGFAISQ